MPPKKTATSTKTKKTVAKTTKAKPSKKEEVEEVEEVVEERPRRTRARKVDSDKPKTETEDDVPEKKKKNNEPASTSESDQKTTKKRTARGATKNPKPEKITKTEKEKKPLVNPSATVWDDIEFKCEKKNANDHNANMHITSWNVAGLRAWIKKGGLEILEHDEPDIFCIQETKCSLENLPEEVTQLQKYKAYWSCAEKAGYSGVGILTRVMPIDVTYGIGAEEHDTEGRCITAEYKHFYLVNVYVPNAGRKLVTLPKRLEWNEAFKTFIKKLDKKKPVIICGDMNVSHNEIDLANPKANKKNAGFTMEEREGMTDFLKDGYIDSFRELYPDRTDAYTFWTHMANARARNIGWRLDYFIVSERIMKNVCDNIMYDKILGSDHCPITLYLEI